MLHYASIILAILVWMTENIAAVQKLDRQQECNDGVGCGFVATFMSCDIIEARCPETCGKCVGEEAACEDAEHCGLLFEHPEVTGPNFVQEMCDTQYDGTRLGDICKKTCNTCPEN